MTLQADNVRVGLDGRLFSAPSGTEIPDDPTAELDPGVWTDHGWLDKDAGIFTEKYNEETKNIDAAQGGVTVRKLTTSSTHECTATMLETKGSNLELFHKGSQIEDLGGGISRLKVRPPGVDRRVFLFTLIDGDDLEWHILPDGEVTGREDVQHTGQDATKYGITLTGYPVQLEGDDFTSSAVKLFSEAGALEEIGS